MDCFRSGLEGTDAFGTAVVVEDRGGGADCVPPKKSSPRSESPGFVCFGAAGSPLGGGGRVIDGSVVLGRGGADAASSPKRSMFGARLADDCRG